MLHLSTPRLARGIKKIDFFACAFTPSKWLEYHSEKKEEEVVKSCPNHEPRRNSTWDELAQDMDQLLEGSWSIRHWGQPLDLDKVSDCLAITRLPPILNCLIHLIWGLPILKRNKPIGASPWSSTSSRAPFPNLMRNLLQRPTLGALSQGTWKDHLFYTLYFMFIFNNERGTCKVHLFYWSFFRICSYIDNLEEKLDLHGRVASTLKTWLT